jgi:hypothetical protein
MSSRVIIVPGEEPPEHPVVLITVDQLREGIRGQIERNRYVPRTNPVQKRIDEVIAVAFEADDIYLAGCLMLVQSARAAKAHDVVLEVLMQTMADLLPHIRATQKCRVCGCTNEAACFGGCEWVELDLCSRCVLAANFHREAGDEQA